MVIKTSMMDLYRQTLAGFIQDDDRLVTYKWLSKELEVHVNTAKEILADYWEEEKKNDIVATFLLIGDTKEGGKRVEVVKDEDVAIAKERYAMVTSQHIYSLQKRLADIEALASAGAGDIRFAAIKGNRSKILTEEEFYARRWGAGEPYYQPAAASEIEKTTGVPTLKAKSQECENREIKTDDVKKLSPPEKIIIEKKGTLKKPVQSTKTGFNALFGKLHNQKDAKNPSKTLHEAKKSAKIPAISINEKIDDCLIDVDFDQDFDKKSTMKDLSKVKSSLTKNKSLKNNEKSTNTDESPVQDRKLIINGASVSGKSKNATRGKKRGRSRESQEGAKKRKRIVVASDSSGQSDSDGEADPLGALETEEISNSVSSCPLPVERRKKIHKMVDKTFVDEDGFMVTKKIQVIESCSEDDEQPPRKEKEKKPSPPKEATSRHKKNNKQTSITNFFKKV